MSSRQGFNLIELSIVLVVIGLIVGGILVGRDLILAASMRKAVTQLEKYTTAVNTFKLKFGCLPADCYYDTLNQIGLTNPQTFFTYNPISDPYQNNQDGLICSDFGYGGARAMNLESNIFFLHLQQALLVSDPLDPNLVSHLTSGGMNTSASGDTAWPKLSGSGLGVFPVAFNGLNYWRTGFIQTQNDGYTASAITRFAYTPTQALYIDTKLDDGQPTSGKITATGNLNYYTDPWMFVPTIDTTQWTGAPSYLTNGASIDGVLGANNPVCFNSGSNVYNGAFTASICNLAIQAGF